jgi:hypothetical protein
MAVDRYEMKQEMMHFLKNVFAKVPEEMITQALI